MVLIERTDGKPWRETKAGNSKRMETIMFCTHYHDSPLRPGQTSVRIPLTETAMSTTTQPKLDVIINGVRYVPFPTGQASRIAREIMTVHGVVPVLSDRLASMKTMPAGTEADLGGRCFNSVVDAMAKRRFTKSSQIGAARLLQAGR